MQIPSRTRSRPVRPRSRESEHGLARQSANAARERLRVAHALAGVPKIHAAFAEGSVSFSKVRAMTRVATPENEDLLLNIARHGTAYHVERFVSQYRRIETLSEPGAAAAIHERRELTHYYDDDGCLVIRARLPAEQGALVVKALELAMDVAVGEGDSEITAETSDDGVTANGVSLGQTSETPSQREPIGARRADALCDIAESYLNHPENAGSTADRYQVVVHESEDGSTHRERALRFRGNVRADCLRLLHDDHR